MTYLFEAEAGNVTCELLDPLPSPPPPPRLQVNRGTCRFGRYKNPRRPHPPPCASRVSHHPPQVSGLTLAHPCSPTLTRRPARSIDSGCAGPFLGPDQRGRNGLPRRCRFWVATHRMLDPPSRLLFSFSCHLAASLLLAGSFVFSSASTPALLCIDTLHFLLVLYPLYFYYRPYLELSIPLLPEQMGRKRTAEDYHRTAVENSWVPGGP